SFARFLATSEGQTRVDLKHVTIALQSQMVGSQPFDALPVPQPAIASDSIQTTKADRVVSEIQALRDRSIGDLVGSQPFDALPVPGPAIASDSIQTTKADRVVSEMQALRDRSIGDLGRIERAEADAPSRAFAIAVSAI